MKHIIVATKYLTKQVEARAIKINDAIYITNFIYEQIIIGFGCPKSLISDGGTDFLNSVIEEKTNRFNINYYMNILYYPQINSYIERVNQTLFNILRKIVYDFKNNKDIKLPAILWAYYMTRFFSTIPCSFNRLL